MHLHPFLPRLFDLVCTFWHYHTEQVLALVEELAASLRDQFRPFVPRLLPLLLESLVAPASDAAAAAAAAAASASTGAGHRPKVVSSGGVLDASTSYQESSARTLKLVLRTMVRLRAMLRGHANVAVPALAKLVDAIGEQLGREAARAVDARSVDWPSRVVVTLAHLCNDPALKTDPTVSLAPRLLRSLMRLVDRPGPPTPLTKVGVRTASTAIYPS